MLESRESIAERARLAQTLTTAPTNRQHVEFRRLFMFVHDELGCHIEKDSCVNYPYKPWCVVDIEGDVIARGETLSEAMAEVERTVEKTPSRIVSRY